MKKNILINILFCVLIYSTSWAQKQKAQNNPDYDKRWFNLGFTLGMNTMDFRLIHSGDFLNPVVTDSIFGVEAVCLPGFSLGIISDLRLSDYFNLRFLPGLSFGQRNLEYKVRDFDLPEEEIGFTTYYMKLPSIFIDAPLSVKFNAERINNYRPYMLGGASAKYDLESRKVRQRDIDYKIRTKALDYYFELGFGISYYLSYFKFSTEIKACFGTQDMLVRDNTQFTNSLESMKSKVYMISMHFE